jgi:hypothetical protein
MATDTTESRPACAWADALQAIEEGRIASHLRLAEMAPPKLLSRWGSLVLALDRADAHVSEWMKEIAATEKELAEVEAQLSEWQLPARQEVGEREGET